MTTEEIIEYNKMCAEFSGWKYCEKDLVFNSKIDGHPSHNSVFSGWVKKEQPYTKGVPLFVVKQNRMEIEYKRKLLYHSDWNWIMEVVEAIETKFLNYTLQWEYDDREEFAEDGKYKAYWFTLYPKDEICSGLTSLRNKSRKEAVIQAINQFLIWYNGNSRN